MDDVTLNRAIAEALGYRLETEDNENWIIYRHAQFQGLVCFGTTEAAAWADAFEDKPDYGSELPRWAQDAGAALRLWADLLAQHATTWELGMGALDDGEYYAALSHPGEDWTATAPTPARALALLALLALRAPGGERDGGNDGTP